MIRLLLILFVLGWSESLDESLSDFGAFSMRRFSNKRDCSRYFNYFPGMIVPMKCPLGKIFDCNSKSCANLNPLRDTSCCKLRNFTVGESCFALDLVAPNIFNCTSYFRCVKWRIAKFACPDNMKFNFMNGNCVNGSQLVPCLDELLSTVLGRIQGFIGSIPAVPAVALPNLVNTNLAN